MGCFNLVDGYSGLEIHNNDLVQLHFLVNNEFGDGFLGNMCYPQDAFALFAPPIKAKYNEYGWYTFDETDVLTQLIQQEITRRIDLSTLPSRSYKGSKEYFIANQDLDVKDRALIPWEVVGELIHDGELFLTNKYHKPVKIYLSKFAVHDKLYQDLANADIKCGWGKKAELLKDKVRKQVEAICIPPDVYVELKRRDDAGETLTSDEIRLMYKFESRLYDSSNDRLEFISSTFSIGAMSRMETPSGEKLSVERIIELVIGMTALNMAMDRASRMYLPSSGGHQCYNFDDEIAYLESILAYVKERKADFDDEYGEDEDDDEDE